MHARMIVTLIGMFFLLAGHIHCQRVAQMAKVLHGLNKIDGRLFKILRLTSFTLGVLYHCSW